MSPKEQPQAETPVFSPTFDVGYTHIDGEVRTYTFRKAKSNKVLEWDAVEKQITTAEKITESDVLNLIIPLIDDQLQTIAMPQTAAAPAKILEPKVDLYYQDAVQLFFLMKVGADCSYESKKDFGSPSPSAGEASTHTIATR